MIEIKISLDAALALLMARLKLELKLRKRANLVPESAALETLPFKKLNELVETAVIDTVFMLPMDLLMLETNLVHIVTETIKALSKSLNREEFLLYPNRQAQKLVQRAIDIIAQSTKDDQFKNN